MRDLISLNRAKLLHPYIKDEVIITITSIETKKFPDTIAIRIAQGMRTFAEQQAIYNQGRTTPGPVVTQSKPGQSYHNYGLAIDFALLYDKDGNGTFETLSWDVLADMDHDGEADWREVVDSFEQLQYTWGGHFTKHPDDPHLEKHAGIHWSVLLQRYNSKDFIAGTNFVRL